MNKSSFFQDPDLDQVFLKDNEVLDKIVEFSDLKKTETVLEIGSGPGNLTEKLAAGCRKVLSIEVDERLKPELEEKFRKKNVEFIWGNALRILDGHKLKYDKVVSNPPYAICEPLINSLFRQKFKMAVLTLPWRFVERLTANPEEDFYSKLSLFTQSFFKIETLLRIEKDAWHPRPDTASMVLRLTPKKSEGADFLLREMILQDDKKLKNALREALVKTEGKTKKSAKSGIDKFKLSESLLEKKISEMSLEDVLSVVKRFVNG